MISAPRFFVLRISVYYAAAFVVGGLVTPFLPVWLKDKGLGAEEIATCMAFPLAARIVFMPIGSWLADHMPNRRMAIVLFSLLALLLFIPATMVTTYWPLLLLSGLAITVSWLAMPALDALALTGVRRFGLDYGKMRVWGSISFVAVSLVGGLIFGHFGAPILTPLLIGGFAVAFVMAFLLPVTPRVVRAMDDASAPVRRSAWSVLASPSFLVIVGSTSLIQASHCIFYSFGTIHWEALGFSGGEIGLLWAIGVLAEITTFALSGRFGALKAETLILIGALAAIVRWALFPIATSLAFSLALQSLHGLTFAAAFVGMQVAIARTVPDEMTASAQGFCQMASGALMALTTFMGGPLYARFGVESIWVMTIFGALAALVILIGSRTISPRVRRAAG